MERTLTLARSLVSDLGADTAVWIAFAAERAYWQRRNRPGQVKKSQQDSLGLSWANNDHYTFRCADVDLAPGEVASDFAHQHLPPLRRPFDSAQGRAQDTARREPSTVGLWCALHGESMRTAGLHHPASRLDFDAATAGLAEWGIEMMRQPVSDIIRRTAPRTGFGAA